MNLQQEEIKKSIELSPKNNVEELLRLSNLLHSNIAWRTTLFDGESGPRSSTKLTEARADVQRCIWKLEKIFGEIEV